MDKMSSGVLALIGLTLLVNALIQFQSSIIPFTMALMLALMLMPVVNVLERYLRVPRMLASILVVLLLICAFYPLSTIVYASVAQFVGRVGIYEEQFNIIINQLAEQFHLNLGAINGDFRIRNWLASRLPGQNGWLVGGANKFFGIAAHLVIILFFSFFILNERNLILRKLRVLMSGEGSRLVERTITTITNQIGRYLLLKTFTSLLTGVLVYFVMIFFGVEAPLTWAFFTFLLNFIPNIGSVVITLLIGLMGLIQFYPMWDRVFGVFFSVVAIQMLIGNILDPLIQGDQLDLSPLVILISLVFWGAIWGLEGMFLSVPLTETIKIICANTNRLRPVSLIITSGRALPRLPEEPPSLLRKLFGRKRS